MNIPYPSLSLVWQLWIPSRKRFCGSMESQRTGDGLEGNDERGHQEVLVGPWIHTKKPSSQGMGTDSDRTFFTPQIIYISCKLQCSRKIQKHLIVKHEDQAQDLTCIAVTSWGSVISFLQCLGHHKLFHPDRERVSGKYGMVLRKSEQQLLTRQSGLSVLTVQLYGRFYLQRSVLVMIYHAVSNKAPIT